jgi:EpsI family protein
MRSNWRATAAVVAILSAQAAGVQWLSGAEHPPAMAELAAFPEKLGSWSKSGEDAVDPASLEQLGADRTLSWNFLDSRTGNLANVFVAWFQSQRGGATQPHSPRVCLPGNGWGAEELPAGSVATAGGEIPVNRLLVSKASRRALVVYWYQSPRRVVASEWAAKFWLIPDSLRDRRTDTSLVRVTVWQGEGQDQAAADLAARVYGTLRMLLPR